MNPFPARCAAALSGLLLAPAATTPASAEGWFMGMRFHLDAAPGITSLGEIVVCLGYSGPTSRGACYE